MGWGQDALVYKRILCPVCAAALAGVMARAVSLVGWQHSLALAGGPSRPTGPAQASVRQAWTMSGEQQLHICNQPLLGQGHCRTNTPLCGQQSGSRQPARPRLDWVGVTMIEVVVIDVALAG